MQRTPATQQQRNLLLNLKMGRGLEQIYLKRSQTHKKAHRKMLPIIFSEIQIKTRMRCHLIPIRVGTVLVCYSCHKRGALIVELCFLTFWRLKVPRCWQLWFLPGPLSVACRWQPFHCVLTWPFPCVCTSLVSLWKTKSPFLMRTLVRWV